MDKHTNKYDAVRASVVTQLAKEFQCTESFIRLCIKGERTSETAEKISVEYRNRYQKVKAAINS